MSPGSTRQRLQQAITRIAKRMARNDDKPNIDQLAIRLSSKYPQSGIALDEICAAILASLYKERDHNAPAMPRPSRPFERLPGLGLNGESRPKEVPKRRLSCRLGETARFPSH
jgi:hypothetical protein